MTRSVTGCEAGAGVPVPMNATLASCADLGFFDSGDGLATLTTVVSPSWSVGVWVALAAVVLQWVWAVDVITGQTWRAGALLPHGIFLRASRFTSSFYTLALVFTGTYIVLKYMAFGAQPSSVTVTRGGAEITVALASVFANVGKVGNGAIITVASSIATLWFSFAGINSLVARNAADAYADITLSALIECRAAGKGPCDSHDSDAGVPSPVVQSIAAPMLHLDAKDCDQRLKAWFENRGLVKRLPWRDVRWLRRCPSDLVADAAAWIKSGEGAAAATSLN